jgi:hypothetical protein
LHPHNIAVGLSAGVIAAAAWFVASRVPVVRKVPLGAFLVAGWLGALARVHPPELFAADEEHWVPVVAVVAAVVAAGALFLFDQPRREVGVAPLLLAMTIGGAFLAIPDTELLVLLGAATAPLVALSLRRAGPQLGVSAVPLAAIFVWAAAYEARGRPASFIAAMACWGLIVLEPALRLVRAPRLSSLVVSASHLAFVVVVARGAGLERSATVTAVKVTCVAVVAIVLRLVGPRVLASPQMQTNGPPR